MKINYAYYLILSTGKIPFRGFERRKSGGLAVKQDPKEMRVPVFEGVNQRITHEDPEEQREKLTIHFNFALTPAKPF